MAWIAGALVACPGLSIATQPEPPTCERLDSRISGKNLMAPDAPYGAQTRSIQGWVIVELYVAADGRAREPNVLYSTPAQVFDDNAVRALLQSEYHPARRAGAPVGSWSRVNYVFGIGVNNGRPLVEEFQATVRERAEAGSASNQFLHGVLIAMGGLLAPKNPDSEAGYEWMLKAADGGSSRAQLMLARHYYVNDCHMLSARVEGLLKAAAQSGDMLGSAELVRLARDAALVASLAPLADRWLEQRDGDRNIAAGRALAEALIKADLEVEAKVLPMIRKLISRQDYYPPVYELRAAARARLGQLAEAVKDQQKALTMARELQWNTQPQERRLEAYRAGKPWEGDILLPQ